MTLPVVPTEAKPLSPAEVRAWDDLRRSMLTLAAAIDRFQKMSNPPTSPKNSRNYETS